MNSRIALVTGATSGIGRTFTRYLASGGYDVVAVSRRTDRMGPLVAESPDVKIRPLAAALSTDQGAGVRWGGPFGGRVDH
jgi:uncharacterized protein